MHLYNYNKRFETFPDMNNENQIKCVPGVLGPLCYTRLENAFRWLLVVVGGACDVMDWQTMLVDGIQSHFIDIS